MKSHKLERCYKNKSVWH